MYTMIDALYPAAITDNLNPDLTAGYIDHSANPSSFSQACARFPDAHPVKISVKGTVGADMLDCETSTRIRPKDCVPWVVDSRKAGIDPVVYCNQGDPVNGWPAIRETFVKAGVDQPHYVVARYDGIPNVPDGAIGKQFTDLDSTGRNTYDTSCITWWPGFDHHAKEPEMFIIYGLDSNGISQHLLAMGGAIYHLDPKTETAALAGGAVKFTPSASVFLRMLSDAK